MVQFYKAPKQKNNVNSAKNNIAKSNGYKETIQMDTFDHAANGICLSSKPITIVEQALPNEVCEVLITKKSKSARFGHVIKVLDANPERLAPFCEYFDKCGGCGLQHTSADYGLSIKNQALKSYLQKNSDIKPEHWLSPIISNYPQYRRRVRLSVDARALKSSGSSSAQHSAIKSATIGYRSAQSNKIVDIPHCAIANPDINDVIAILHSDLKSDLGMTKVGHIVVTQGSNFVQLALFLTGNLPKSTKQVLLDISQRLNIQVCLLSKQGKGQENAVQSSGYKKEIIGSIKDEVELNILLSELDTGDLEAKRASEVSFIEGIKRNEIVLKLAPMHFLQVNEGVNQQMLTLARDWIYTFLNARKSSKNNHNGVPVLYDFFCGSGNFSLALADLFERVYGYEGVEDMVDTAIRNAGFNHVNNCEFTHIDLNNKVALDKIEFADNAIVLLDPSREGAQNLASMLATKQIAMIIYVSCNPNSFARDIKQLNRQYQVNAICALDMFPYTKHIELMAKILPR